MFTIEKDVPMKNGPSKRDQLVQEFVETFESMEVGDSFVFADATESNKQAQYAARAKVRPKQFVGRTIANGVQRVWRIR